MDFHRDNEMLACAVPDEMMELSRQKLLVESQTHSSLESRLLQAYAKRLDNVTTAVDRLELLQMTFQMASVCFDERQNPPINILIPLCSTSLWPKWF
jgi:hypothetical protein